LYNIKRINGPDMEAKASNVVGLKEEMGSESCALGQFGGNDPAQGRGIERGWVEPILRIGPLVTQCTERRDGSKTKHNIAQNPLATQ
jgi:hypothetical protein